MSLGIGNRPIMVSNISLVPSAAKWHLERHHQKLLLSTKEETTLLFCYLLVFISLMDGLCRAREYNMWKIVNEVLTFFHNPFFLQMYF